MGTILKRYNGTAWVPIELDASSVGGYTPAELLNYDNLTNAPEKVSFVLRDIISSDTANTLKEIEINGEKWKIEGGSSSGSADVTADMVSIDPESTLHSAENVQDAISYIKDDLINHLTYKSVTSYFIHAIFADDDVTIYSDSDSSNTLKDLAFDVDMGRSGVGAILEIVRHYRSGGTEAISFSLPQQSSNYVLKMLTPSTFILFEVSSNTIADIVSFSTSKLNYPLSYISVCISDDGGSGEYEISGHVSYEQYTMIDF